jgi:ABC-type iron transport system FetAB permease component
MSVTDDQPQPTTSLVPWMAVAGAALLLIGSFCPAVTGADGAQSYRDLAWADGNVILATAVVAFALTWVFRWYRGLFVAGGVALFMIGATLLKVPRAGLDRSALSWGWLPLIAGAVLLLTAAAVAERERPPAPAEEESEEDELNW